VEHTTQVRAVLDDMVSRMKDAETGQRGFLLSGKEVFLEPYIGAKDEVMDFFTKVQLMTVENQSQQTDFPVVAHLIDEKFYIINSTIADKRKGVLPATGTLLRGKQIMDSIRTVVKGMVEREDKLMINRNAKMVRFATYTPILIAIAALLSMIVTIVFYYRVQKDAHIAIELQNELLKQEQKTKHQIEVITNLAKKIADGDYSTRIEKSDLD
jgi:CHASE3 domain sensor protein